MGMKTALRLPDETFRRGYLSPWRKKTSQIDPRTDYAAFGAAHRIVKINEAADVV